MCFILCVVFQHAFIALSQLACGCSVNRSYQLFFPSVASRHQKLQRSKYRLCSPLANLNVSTSLLDVCQDSSAIACCSLYCNLECGLLKKLVSTPFDLHCIVASMLEKHALMHAQETCSVCLLYFTFCSFLSGSANLMCFWCCSFASCSCPFVCLTWSHVEAKQLHPLGLGNKRLRDGCLSEQPAGHAHEHSK